MKKNTNAVEGATKTSERGTEVRETKKIRNRHIEQLKRNLSRTKTITKIWHLVHISE